MGQSLDESRPEPKVVGSELTIIFTLTQSGVGKGLSVSIDQLVLLQLIVEVELTDERDGILKPERMIGNRLDLVRRFQHPTLAPCVNDPVVVGRTRDKGERDFESDCVDVYACLAVSAIVDKAEVTVGVFEELVAVPGQWAGREFALVIAIAPPGIVWIEVE